MLKSIGSFTALFFVSILFFQSCRKGPQEEAGWVVAEEPIAAEVGRQVLENGGNAADAAIATAFALAVTFPEAGNIGGGGFALYRSKEGVVRSFDFRETAPSAANAYTYLDEDSILVANSNHRGIRSVGVPGTIAGLGKLHEELASKPWSELLDPAIELARNGFQITKEQVAHFNKYKSKLLADSSTASVFFSSGSVPATGTTLVQDDLANTLRRISAVGWEEFYTGHSARQLARYCDSLGGWISLEDLENYKCIERQPTKTLFRGATIYGMPEPSSGGLTTALILKAIGVLSQKYDGVPNRCSGIHMRAEAMRMAFEQRAQLLGDPKEKNGAFSVEEYLDQGQPEELMSSFDEKEASKSVIQPEFEMIREGLHTTHFSIVDKEGNAISLTYTLEQNYGSGIMVEGLGYLLNNEMGDFNPWPGHTDSTGLIGTSPNLVRPGARMLSSMSPTIIVKNDQIYAVLGTRGGRTIINSVVQVIDNNLRHNMSPWESVSSTRVHHQWFPDQIYYEKDRLPPSLLDSLSAMGYELKALPTIGSVMAIIRNNNGHLEGVADLRAPRGEAIKTRN